MYEVTDITYVVRMKCLCLTRHRERKRELTFLFPYEESKGTKQANTRMTGIRRIAHSDCAVLFDVYNHPRFYAFLNRYIIEESWIISTQNMK